MKQRSLLVVFAAVFLAQSAWSQGHSSLSTNQMNERNKNRVTLDAAPLLVGGLGISYQRELTPSITVGPRVSLFNLKSSEDTTSFQSKHRITNIGADARWFKSGATDDSMYLVGGVVMANVSSEAQFKGTSSGSATTSSVGPLLGIGYQVNPQGQLFPKDTTALNFGAIYSHGAKISSTAYSLNGGKTEVRDLKA